ncbi:porin OmpF [Tatumella citrea]|uniref:Porin OmpC n=1 Tax=Tatumella citrea TaxID=53336 RepID=A0A1Y0LHH7_TATCI|nr:porin OmpF [Tatumella citrea]ARU93534.1 porin OmpC [Tatumella citrea]ARU97573.1 porin OmpC [Tatumella citrea]
MMKRNILAVVIPALLVAGAANAAEIYNKDGNKLDLYGKVDGLHYFSKDSGSDGDQSYIRFGFKGETQINDWLTGYGQWEYNVQANNSEGSDAQDGNKTRLGFAGLKAGQYGSIDYGRNYGITYDVLGWTDMIPEFGDDYAVSDTLTGRTTGVATYRNTNFFGLVDGWNFAVQYQGKNDRDDSNFQKSNGDGYGISTSYTSPIGVGITGSFASQNRTDAQKTGYYGKGDHAQVWATGLKYDANNVYLAATYAQGQNISPISKTVDTVTNSGFANKTQDIEIVAQYQFDFGLRPSLGYVQTKAKDVEGIGDVDIVKYVDVAATYYFNKNMSTYVDYKINQLNKDNQLGIASDDTVAVGLVYQF